MIKLDNEKALSILKAIETDLNSKEILDVNTLDKERTVLVNVDMINGFCKEGALYSPRNKEIIKPVLEINEVMKDFTKIFFRDNHKAESLEFNSYPPHCTSEGESSIVDELKKYIKPKDKVFDKNSTNGYFATEFRDWFVTYNGVNTFVVVGDCTDICVLTFVLTLKTKCDQINEPINIIVPVDCVDTFDLDATNHYAELMNSFALYNMQMNGVKLVKTIK